MYKKQVKVVKCGESQRLIIIPKVFIEIMQLWEKQKVELELTEEKTIIIRKIEKNN